MLIYHFYYFKSEYDVSVFKLSWLKTSFFEGISIGEKNESGKKGISNTKYLMSEKVLLDHLVSN